VSGEIKLMVASGKRFEHAGVRLELKGVVEAATEKAPYEFLSLVQEVAGAGALSGLQSLPFAFPAVDFPVESYSGAKARVRYVLRAIVATRGGGFGGGSGEQRREAEFAVRTPHAAAPALGGSGGVDAAALAADPDAPILLEVGIEDCLHIEFQYSRMRYHLADTVTGHIDFKQLGIKLRKMEVAVVRKENVGTRECAGQETAAAAAPFF
jgi:vacuolar protein sorting-associated protein 26